MNDMAKSILRFLGYLFGVLVLGFTGVQTWNLLYGISNNPVIAVLGLVLFEGSMLYWWFFFQKEAEGLMQMGLSLLVAIFGLALVGGATALHLGAVDADLLGQQTPARLVTVAAIVNLVAKFLMPLLHPDVMKITYKKALTGKVLTQTFAQFETKVKEIAVQLAEDVAEDWKEDVRQEILALHMSRPHTTLITPNQQGENELNSESDNTMHTSPISVIYPASSDMTAEERQVAPVSQDANGTTPPPFGSEASPEV